MEFIDDASVTTQVRMTPLFHRATGEPLWEAELENNRGGLAGNHGEQVHHPVIAGGLLVAEPKAYDPHTGRPHVAAGAADPFYIGKRNGCGTITGAADTIFYRDSNPIAQSLAAGARTTLSRVSRPGCWINVIPAGGLVIAAGKQLRMHLRLRAANFGCICPGPLIHCRT